MFESLGIYSVLIMHFPMLKGTKLGKTVVIWSCSALCAWEEPHKRDGGMHVLCN